MDSHSSPARRNRSRPKVGRLVAVAFVALLAVPTPEAASTPAETDDAVCVWSLGGGTMSPGLLMFERRSVEWSGGQGTITCRGRVNGHDVTGPGSLQTFGTLEGTCAEGSGSGTDLITLPTTGGPVELVEAKTFSWTGLLGSHAAPHLSGVFQFVPTAGDCVTAPVIRFALLGEGVLRTG